MASTTTEQLQTFFKQLGAGIRVHNAMIFQRAIPENVHVVGDAVDDLGEITLNGVDFRSGSANLAPNGRLYARITEDPGGTFNIDISKVKDSFSDSDIVANKSVTAATPLTWVLDQANSSGLTGEVDLDDFTADNAEIYFEIPIVTARTQLLLEQVKLRDEVESGEFKIDFLQDLLTKIDQGVSSVDDVGNNIRQAIRRFIETEGKSLLQSEFATAEDIIEFNLILAMLGDPLYGHEIIEPNFGPASITSATSNTLTLTGAGWTIDEHINRLVVITAGAGSVPQTVARILSNTATVLTLEENWPDVIPDGTFEIQTPSLVPQFVLENTLTIGTVFDDPNNRGRGLLEVLALDVSTSQARRSMMIPTDESFRATCINDSTAGQEVFSIVGDVRGALSQQITVESGRLEFEEIGVEIEILRGTQIDSGTSTGAGTTTTLVDSGGGWTTDEHIGRRIRLVRGTGEGQESVITSNTATELTFSPAILIVSDDTTDYDIIEDREEFGAATSATTNTLTDTALSMVDNVHVGRILKITSGDASGDEKTILANDGDTFTISGTFSDTIVATDTFEVIANWQEDDELHFRLTSDNEGIFSTYFRDIFEQALPIKASGSETIDEDWAT